MLSPTTQGLAQNTKHKTQNAKRKTQNAKKTLTSASSAPVGWRFLDNLAVKQSTKFDMNMVELSWI